MNIIRYCSVLALLILLGACTDSPEQEFGVAGEDTAQVDVQEAVEPEVDPLEEARRLAEEQAAELARLAEETRLAGEAYLHINAQKPGVRVLESGLQFEIIESGEGKTPTLTSKVLAHYHGTLVNGEIFDSSIERGEPAEFPVNRLIAGWTEALQMMKEGDVWQLVVPPHLAYGDRQVGDRIAPNSVLIFEVELIEVLNE